MGQGGPGRRRFAAIGDQAAISASVLCLVHCLALPLAVSFFPTIAQVADLPEWFHLVLVLIAMPISGWAMAAGYRRHGAMLPVTWAIMGLLLMALGAWGGWSLAAETGITVVGSIILMLAHFLNWRARLAAFR